MLKRKLKNGLLILCKLGLFIYGLRGLALSSRSELQQVLERRKRVQSDQEGEGQSRTPLEDVLLRRQQQQIEVINPIQYVNRLINGRKVSFNFS